MTELTAWIVGKISFKASTWPLIQKCMVQIYVSKSDEVLSLNCEM